MQPITHKKVEEIKGKMLWITMDAKHQPDSLALTKTIIRSLAIQYHIPEDANIIAMADRVTVEQIRAAGAVMANMPAEALQPRIDLSQKLEFAKRSDAVIMYTSDISAVEQFYRDYEARFQHIARYQVLHEKTDMALLEAVKAAFDSSYQEEEIFSSGT
ncbi:MAG: hypothetical protein MRY32_05085 [Rickettsiales bacterium]|nr:hypothetical protein [Rickettsiales bacterium]